MVPFNVLHLINSILSTDFEEYEKWIKKMEYLLLYLLDKIKDTFADNTKSDADVDFFENRIKQYEKLLKIEHK